MKNFIVAIMAMCMIIAGSITSAVANGCNYGADGIEVQGGVTGFAIGDIGFADDYVTLGSASVDIVAGQGMVIGAWGDGGCDYTVDYTQDQTIEATYIDSSVVGSQAASVAIENVEGHHDYGYIDMFGAMGQVGVTKVAVNDLEVGHWENEEDGTEGNDAMLGSGSIDAIGIQAMTTNSYSSGMGTEGNMDLAQDLNVITPNSTIIMTQGSSYHSSSVVLEEIVIP